MEGKVSGSPGSGGTKLPNTFSSSSSSSGSIPQRNGTMEMPPSPPGQGFSAPSAVPSCPCSREGAGSYLLQPDVCGHHLVLLILRWERGRSERGRREGSSHHCVVPQITASVFCPPPLGFSSWEQLVPVKVRGERSSVYFPVR